MKKQLLDCNNNNTCSFETRLCFEGFKRDKYVLLMRLKQQKEVNIKRIFLFQTFRKKRKDLQMFLNFVQCFETGHVASYFIH